MRFLLVIALLLPALATGARAQAVELPDDPLEGRILFETRGCIACHALGGFGGDSGPDLALEGYFGSFLELVADLWNHIPDMNRQYRLRRIPRPEFTEREMLDLAGFIYYLRYLGEPGSVSEGRRLLASRGCTACHGSVRGAPALGELEGGGSPISMVQAMWNHGPAMQEEMERRGLPFPTLSGRDISHMSTYLQMVASHGPPVRAAPGSPERGRQLFEARRCADCHAPRPDEDTGLGPPLRAMDLGQSVVEIAAHMWNHEPAMRAFMADSDLEWPRFEGSEMADLIAYLYFVGFTDEAGEPGAGEAVFRAKGCAACHERGAESLGPDLSTIRSLDRPGRLAQLMWNHADEMADLLLARNEPWPRLEGQDLRHLLAYLKRESHSNQ